MTTSQSRVSRGIPAGGQFSADVHSESAVSLREPAVLANVNRPFAQVTLTEDQIRGLRRHKTPIKDAAARRGVGEIHLDLSATDASIHSIQGRLNGRS